jgi:hypothetical protein
MMTWNRTAFCGLVVCAAVACTAATADAQVERPQRAARGIFGGPAASPNSPQQLDISASLFGAYDDDVTAEQGGLSSAVSNGQDLSGIYSGLTLGLSYNRRVGRNASFGSSAGTSLRYYPSLDGHTLAPIGQQVAAGMSIGSERNSRNHLSFGGDASFSPYYALGLLPSTGAPIEVGDGNLAPQPVNSIINRRETITYGGGVQLERSLGARSTMTLNYGIHTIDFNEESRKQSAQSAGAHYRHSVSKALGWKVGYERSDASFGVGGDAVVNHQIDAGLDFLKPLSLTRRTSMTFSVGPSLLQQNNSRQIRVVGDLALNHEIGRTWAARATYHRGVGMVAGLNSAVFSNGVGAALEGLLSQRLDFSAMGSYSTGEFAITGAANNYDTYQASVRLRAALQRATAVYVEYVAYRYQFDSRVDLPLGIPGRLFRQGLRTGLTLWLPLIR